MGVTTTHVLIVLLLFVLAGEGAFNTYMLFKKEKISIKEDKEDIDFEKVKFLVQEHTAENIDKLLDTYIKDAGEIYKVMELSQNDTEFMKESDINKMSAYIFGTVKKNMTDSTIEALKLKYNINSEDDLNDLIKLRINLYMLDFVTKYNTLLEE